MSFVIYSESEFLKINQTKNKKFKLVILKKIKRYITNELNKEITLLCRGMSDKYFSICGYLGSWADSQLYQKNNDI